MFLGNGRAENHEIPAFGGRETEANWNCMDFLGDFFVCEFLKSAVSGNESTSSLLRISLAIPFCFDCNTLRNRLLASLELKISVKDFLSKQPRQPEERVSHRIHKVLAAPVVFDHGKTCGLFFTVGDLFGARDRHLWRRLCPS